MKKYYLIIPVVIAVIAIAYLTFSHTPNTTGAEDISSATPETQSSNEIQITPAALVQNGSPLLGDPSAKITVVEWGDYQCTYCHAFHQNTKNDLIQKYVDTGKVNFVFRDFPLNGDDSVLAAEATYCADDQNKFWQYHDELYNNWGGERTGWVNQESLDKFATSLGLDLTEFDKCVSSKKYESRVLDNEKFGEKIGVDATPTFIIFGENKKPIKIVGAQPISVFEQVLDNF